MTESGTDLLTEEGVKLLPCPFCGEKPELNDYTSAPAAAWVLVHRNRSCPIAPQVLSFSTRELAIAAWNRRPPSPDLSEVKAVLGLVESDYQTSEKHHPEHVLIPVTTFDRLRSLLAKLEGV